MQPDLWRPSPGFLRDREGQPVLRFAGRRHASPELRFAPERWPRCRVLATASPWTLLHTPAPGWIPLFPHGNRNYPEIPGTTRNYPELSMQKTHDTHLTRSYKACSILLTQTPVCGFGAMKASSFEPEGSSERKRTWLVRRMPRFK